MQAVANAYRLRYTVGMTSRILLLVLGVCVSGACDPGGDDAGGDTDGHNDHEETEVITRVTLTFSPDGGGETVTAAFSDPDGDGGMSGTTDPITLAVDTSYTLSVSFANGLVDPPEDITAEIGAEAEDHQIFVYGSAVAGPATGTSTGLLVHAYGDVESDYGPNDVGGDLPVGLTHTIMAAEAGTGELSVMLRHLPPLNGAPQKTAGLAETLASGGALPGEPDADVTFQVSVQ